MPSELVLQKAQEIADNDQSWTQCPRWQHLYRTVNDKEYRLKLQKNTIRYEVKVTYSATEYSPQRSEWVRIKTYRPKKTKSAILKEHATKLGVPVTDVKLSKSLSSEDVSGIPEPKQ